MSVDIQDLKRILNLPSSFDPYTPIANASEEFKRLLLLKLKNNTKWSDEGEHLIWTGPTNLKGYSIINVRNWNYTGHRLVLRIRDKLTIDQARIKGVTRHGGDCPNGCVQAEHFQWGTQGDNNRDTVAYGHAKIGENHPRAHLNDEIAKKIGSAILAPGQTRWNLATQLSNEIEGVETKAIDCVLAGLTWNSVTGIPKPVSTSISVKEMIVKIETDDEVFEAAKKRFEGMQEDMEIDPQTGCWFSKYMPAADTGYARVGFKGSGFRSSRFFIRRHPSKGACHRSNRKARRKMRPNAWYMRSCLFLPGSFNRGNIRREHARRRTGWTNQTFISTVNDRNH